MEDIPPRIVVDTVARTLDAQKTFAVFCFWLRCDGDRDALRRELETSLSGIVAVPVVLRAALFNDPNAWAFDVVRLLDECRTSFEAHAEEIANGAPCALIVIARGELSIGQSSSPATLPGWFAHLGGCEITAFARDLRQVASCSLKDELAGVAEMSELLYRVESAASDRLNALMDTDRHHGLQFWDSYLKSRSGLQTRGEFAQALRANLGLVRDVRSYRPSMKAKSSLVAAMWAIFIDESPAKLVGRAKELANFLKLTRAPQSAGGFLFPILFRGVNDASQDAVTRYCRDLIVMVGGACQLITASAHADQYGFVNAGLLNAHSSDSRRFLMHAVELLRSEE